MNNPVDRKLPSRIREVFDDFKDPTADAGWHKLREKYPERNRRPLILWLSTAAALLVLVAGLWLVNPTNETAVLRPGKEERTITKIEKSKSESGDDEIGVKKEIVLKPLQGQTDYDGGHKPRTERTKLAAGSPIQDAALLEGDFPSHRGSENQLLTINDTLQISTGQVPPEVIGTTKMASLHFKVQNDFDVLPIKPDKPSYQDLADYPKIDRKDNDKKPANKDKKLAFSVFAGSYYNYSEGSDNQLNFGAGFISDIRLSRNLKLSTGVGIAANSLNFDLNKGPNLPQSASASFDSSLKLSSANLTTITSYQAKLLTLDIPLNIKYQFIPESDRFYISTGLSSGTHLSETYAYKYRIFNTASGSYASRNQDQSNRKQFNDFDLGQTFNFSVGVSTLFGQGQSISIEPFLKYPLGGLGSEKLKFGAKGVNLTLRFKSIKR